jgi:hypothetical protein
LVDYLFLFYQNSRQLLGFPALEQIEDPRFSKELCWACGKPIIEHPKGFDGLLLIGFRCGEEQPRKQRRLGPLTEEDIERIIREILFKK